MNALVIGQGSIGQRHAGILTRLGLDVGVVSQHLEPGQNRFSDLQTAVKQMKPDYVVIANSTAKHFTSLQELHATGYSGKILIEKPVFENFREIGPLGKMQVFVGYNLRFHPILTRLKNILADQKICSINAYVGQYLPSWRPHQDYRKSYSAQKKEGGGVLRDLSHELDYLTWIFGHWNSVTAIAGKFSDLDIDAEDTCSILMRTARCPVITLELNYLDRISQRTLTINTAEHTYHADLVNGFLNLEGQTEKFENDRDSTYLTLHQSILNHSGKDVCSLSEGLKTLLFAEAIEKSNREGIWVHS